MEEILVVVDMQKDFIDGALGSEEAVRILPAVIRKIKEYVKKNNAIYFTKDTHTPQYLETQEGRKLPVVHCVKNSKGWELQEDIKQLVEELQAKTDRRLVFEKSIFGSEALASTLRTQFAGEEISIELVGLCTDICVIANAMLLRSFMPEATIKVDASCCAGVTPESHSNALEAMKRCQVEIK